MSGADISTEDFEPEVRYEGIEAPLQDAIRAALREVYDPELPVNIYDLGLIYAIEATTAQEDDHLSGVEGGAGIPVSITMTLTNPNCPVAETLPEEVRSAVAALDGVRGATISLTWTPSWSKERMSPEHQLLFSVMF